MKPSKKQPFGGADCTLAIVEIRKCGLERPGNVVVDSGDILR